MIHVTPLLQGRLTNNKWRINYMYSLDIKMYLHNFNTKYNFNENFSG